MKKYVADVTFRNRRTGRTRRQVWSCYAEDLVSARRQMADWAEPLTVHSIRLA